MPENPIFRFLKKWGAGNSINEVGLYFFKEDIFEAYKFTAKASGEDIFSR